jgi:nucleotidyltransferase substrate binding protein (TIGR01987 family)
MNNPDIRWEQRFSNYKKALAKLGEVVETRTVDELSELEAEGLIQRFEYTYELAWLTLQDLFRAKGYTGVAGPNAVLKQAFLVGVITDEEGWRSLKDSRQLTSHTYDEETAERVVGDIFLTYFGLLKQLETDLEEERSGSQLSIFQS